MFTEPLLQRGRRFGGFGQSSSYAEQVLPQLLRNYGSPEALAEAIKTGQMWNLDIATLFAQTYPNLVSMDQIRVTYGYEIAPILAEPEDFLIPSIIGAPTGLEAITDRMSSHIAYFGSPEAYAAEISRKMAAGIPLDDMEAADLFMQMYPQLFVYHDIPTEFEYPGMTYEETAVGKGIGPIETGISIAGFDLGSSWPILAIVGIGALMIFKKSPKGKSKGKRKKSRRR